MSSWNHEGSFSVMTRPVYRVAPKDGAGVRCFGRQPCSYFLDIALILPFAQSATVKTTVSSPDACNGKHLSENDNV